MPIALDSPVSSKEAPLAGDALQFDLGREAARLREVGSWEREGHSARTLVKQPDLRIVLVAMKAAARIQEHHTDQRISLQALTGRIEVRLPAVQRAIMLPAGSLLAIEGGVPHEVTALEESTFLLTISWR